MREIFVMRFLPSILLWLFLVEPVLAQPVPNPPKTPTLTTQFSFSPPGARSLGMGAAFIGLADDATAAESNPAGLVILNKPEISANFRFSSFYNEFPNTVSEHGSDSFKDDTTGGSFFSFVYPKSRTAFSVYYQEPGNFKSHSEFCCDSAALSGFQNIDSSNSRFRLRNIGASAAVRINPYLSLGATLRLTSLDLQYGTFSIFTTCHTDPTSFPPVCYIDQSIRVERTIDDSDNQFSFNAGGLVHLSANVSIGFVYKSGAEFNLSSKDVFEQNTFTDTFFDTKTIVQPFKIPDSYGAGIAYRRQDTWVLIADIVRITYSDLFSKLEDENGDVVQTLRAEDGVEFHAGTEYTIFWKETPILVRGGFFTDPDHDLFSAIDSSTIHFTFGGGIVIRKNLQIDAAVNLSGTTKEGLISFVQRF